jgi:hypothetical protein
MTASADRHVQLSEPAPPRRVDGDLSGSRHTRRQSDARRGFQACPLEISFPATPHRQIFARRKEWRRFTTPIDSAGRRRLSPIRLCLTGAAPTNLPSSTPSCAAPPSQRRSQFYHTYRQRVGSPDLPEGQRWVLTVSVSIVTLRRMCSLLPSKTEALNRDAQGANTLSTCRRICANCGHRLLHVSAQ